MHRDEYSPPAPDLSYGHAKLGAECILKVLACQNPHLRTISIRLGSLAGVQSEFVPVDPVSRMTCDAIESGRVRINGPDLLVQRLDGRDAAAVIVSLLRLESGNPPSALNLSHPNAHRLAERAEAITHEVARCRAGAEVAIDLTGAPAMPLGRLDTAAFSGLTGWQPQHDLGSIVRSQVDDQLNRIADARRVHSTG